MSGLTRIATTNPMDSPVSQLQKRKQELLGRFLSGNEPHFLSLHAQILDDYFRESFAQSSAGPRMGIEKNPYAILALGGYGRKEQCLHSDIDVLLLFGKKIPNEAAVLVQEIFYPLWDTGLEVSYSTRTLKECLSLASQDFEVLTSLVDARFLCGISSLYSELAELMRRKIRQKNGKDFIQWLVERNEDRHNRFGDSTHLLEPNLKEGLGGLRDYHAMLWLGWAKYQLKEPRDLEYLGYLSHDEFQTLAEAVLFILQVRSWLHHISGRKCDQLYFEYQIKVAEALRFKNRNGQQAVELFLGSLHGHMEFVKQQHLLLLNKIVPRKYKTTRGIPRRRSSVGGIVVGQESLNFESSEAILENPQILLKIFEQSAKLGLPLSVEARRLVKEFLFLVDGEFRQSPGVVQLLQRILVAPIQPLDALDEMLTTGILLALIPEIKNVVNLIQYDEYHVYPVDKHLLHAVQLLKEFGKPALNPQDAFYAQLFREVSRPELLHWAVLLHDVGKGAEGKDHSTHGADIVRRVFQRMNFADSDIDTISFLVSEHLLLTKTATQRDLNDEKAVIQCASKFRNTEELKMLYLLTVADSKATGPKAWNDWIATLLKELFFKVYHILKKGELATPAAVDIFEKKRKEILQESLSIPLEDLESLFEQMSPRYLLYTPVKEVLRHIELYQRLGTSPLVLEAQILPGTDYRTVTVCAQDRPGLFAKISGVFTLNNLDIFDAQIYTWRNRIALDIFKVKAPPDTLFEDEAWARVRKNLLSALSGDLALDVVLDEKLRTYQSAVKTTASRPDKIIVDNSGSDFFTIIEVYTYDFPGLLYRITDALFRCKLDVWVAKITTKVDQVLDIFYVRDFDGQKIIDLQQVEAIKSTIKEVLTAIPQ
ncbi:MAG: [protein-PII] uridylyltransferase [Deltaproteobacteria bacterium]|nr:[protein-PII] uridylyltransferase [Deltaproteobacteria bacterium]